MQCEASVEYREDDRWRDRQCSRVAVTERRARMGWPTRSRPTLLRVCAQHSKSRYLWPFYPAVRP